MPVNLRRYIAWKIVVGIVLVFLVVTLNFYLLEVVPGDPTRVMAPRGGGGQSGALRAQLIAEWGLDKPVADRYVIYVTNILTGNWGTSVTYRPGTDVWDLMAPAEADTFVLIGLGVFLAATIAMALGPVLSRHRGGWGDGLGSLLALLGFSAPIFFVVLVFQYLLAVVYPTFPQVGDVSYNAAALSPLGQALDHAWHLVLPTLVVTVALLGPFVFAGRRQWTVEPVDPAFGFAARLFRAVERTVPSVSLLWAWTIASVVFVETLFELRGLGTLGFQGMLLFDAPVVAAIFLLFSVISVGVITALDVLHALLAPRGDALFSQAQPPPSRIGLEDLGSTARHTFLRPLGLLGLVLLFVIVVLTLAAPTLVGPYPTALQRFQPLLPPSPDHLLGTNRFGYDTWTVFAYGGELPLTLAGEVFAVALVLSVALALATGCLGGWVDRGVAVGLDLLLGLPWFLFFAFYGMVVGRQPLDLGAVVLLSLFCWAIPARLLRSTVLGDVGSDPVRGAPWRPRSEKWVHRLWSLRGKILGYAVMSAAISVLVVSGLGFFGLVSSDHESWGVMIGDAWESLAVFLGQWYAFVPPGLGIMTLTYGLGLIAFALRESDHRAVERSLPVPILEPAPTPGSAPMPLHEPSSTPPTPPGP